MSPRRVFLSVLLVSCCFVTTVRAEEIKTESKITAATVYNDRATLTRVATVKVPAGKHDIVFTGLPVTLMPESLRAAGKSVAKVNFGAITHKVENHLDYIQPKEKELNDKLLVLQDQRKVYEVEKQALEQGRKFLENLGAQAKLRSEEDLAAIDLKPESWAGAADALTTKISENFKASLQQDIQIRNTDLEITKIYNELNQLRTGQKQTYSVTIPLEADAEADLTVELSYQLTGASWQPVYDARYDVKDGKLELVQYGSVWQQTGEDWEGVDLTLSTARPSQGTTLPELETDWLWVEEPQRNAGAGIATMAAAPAYMDAVSSSNEMQLERALKKGESAIPVPVESDAAGAVNGEDPLHRWRKLQEEREAAYTAAQINTQGFIGEYKIVGKSTVKSDGTQSKLLVGGFETENTSHIEVKPQFSNEAYYVVTAKLKGDAPILEGQVNLFRDGAFIGQSYLPMMRPNDEQDLSFGVDDNVTVARNTLKDENSEAGLIAKDSVLERNFVTEIQNLHKEPIDLVVLETVPVPQDQRIRVEILADKTSQGYQEDYKNVKGVTRWAMKVDPNVKSKLNLGWRISWPKGTNIGGL